VLLVEDEVVLRLSTSDILERLGCFVASVGTAEQALDLLSRDDKFELMVTDLGLPGMSGEALAAEVRLRYPRLAVIIASGYGRPATDVDGLQFIAKPYSSIDLEQALDRMRRTVPAS
jgi:DNA-binding NtrC family response regulator